MKANDRNAVGVEMGSAFQAGEPRPAARDKAHLRPEGQPPFPGRLAEPQDGTEGRGERVGWAGVSPGVVDARLGGASHAKLPCSRREDLGIFLDQAMSQ